MTGRLAAAWDRVESGVARALAQDNTPGEIAASFALASAYAALPTAGTALVVFLAAAALSRRVSRVALVAALVVFNPAVKWAVYAASYPLGAALLGPAPGVETVSVVAPDELFAALSVGAVRGVVVRQLLGNALLAALGAVVGYAVVFQLARWYDAGEDSGIGDDETPVNDRRPTAGDGGTGTDGGHGAGVSPQRGTDTAGGDGCGSDSRDGSGADTTSTR